MENIKQKIKTSFAVIEKRKSTIDKALEEISSEQKKMATMLGSILEVMQRAEQTVLLENSRGNLKPIVYNSFRTPQFLRKSFKFTEEYVSFRYEYTNSSCGDEWTTQHKVKIPLKYFSMTKDEIKQVHMEWVKNDIEEKHQKSIEEADRKFKENLKNKEEQERKEYQRLKGKFESHES